MNVYTCACQGTLFFENSQCLQCQREVGWCPVCNAITAVEPANDVEPAGNLTLRCTSCDSWLTKCHNYAVENICNRFVQAEAVDSEAASDDSGTLCSYCQLTKDIPDLTIDGNRQRWYRLEQGKRRLLYTLDFLGLPYGPQESDVELPLSFHFQADPGAEQRNWRPLRGEQQIYTGHADGRITINLRESEPAQREKLRVDFQEAHRTIIGHFRHEIAHYYWDLLVRDKCEEEFIAAFGDHNDPPYAEALQNYYDSGPPADWTNDFVSAYATMHPWEDFAETFATYLDLVSVLETANNLGLGAGVDPRSSDLQTMIVRYQRIGLILNEMNRDMGLKDLVPEVFVPNVVEKMKFVHDLVQQAAEPAAESEATDVQPLDEPSIKKPPIVRVQSSPS